MNPFDTFSLYALIFALLCALVALLAWLRERRDAELSQRRIVSEDTRPLILYSEMPLPWKQESWSGVWRDAV